MPTLGCKADVFLCQHANTIHTKLYRMIFRTLVQTISQLSFVKKKKKKKREFPSFSNFVLSSDTVKYQKIYM